MNRCLYSAVLIELDGKFGTVPLNLCWLSALDRYVYVIQSPHNDFFANFMVGHESVICNLCGVDLGIDGSLPELKDC